MLAAKPQRDGIRQRAGRAEGRDQAGRIEIAASGPEIQIVVLAEHRSARSKLPFETAADRVTGAGETCGLSQHRQGRCGSACIRKGDAALDVGENRRRDGIDETRGDLFGVLQLVRCGDAGKRRNGVARGDLSEIRFALNADDPVRCELVIATDLATADDGALAAAAVIEGRNERCAGKFSPKTISFIPTGADVAAEVTSAPTWRCLINRRSFGVGPRHVRRERCA